MSVTPWTDAQRPIPGHRTEVEQHWCVGAHGNISGGRRCKPATKNPPSLLAREWIVDQADEAGLVVDPPDAPRRGNRVERTERRHPEDGPRLASRLWLLNEHLLRPVRKTAEETLRCSVLRRWDDADPPYRPRTPGLAERVRALVGAR